jgi:hypothetical protein
MRGDAYYPDIDDDYLILKNARHPVSKIVDTDIDKYAEIYVRGKYT